MWKSGKVKKNIYRQNNWTMSLKLPNWGHATKELVIINYELITVFELVSSILLGLWGQGGRVEVWAFKSLSRLNFEGWSMKWKFSNIRICSNLFLIWLEPQNYVTKYSASIRLNCISDLKMVANSRLKASISQSLKHFFLQ